MRIKLFILTIFLFFGFRPVFADSVVLNELMPHPSPGSDWIEIYNPTSSDINLSNWTLVDSTSKIKTLSGNIPPNGFITLDITNRLNNAGDSIYLKDVGGASIDNYSYDSDPGINISFGRSPDGGNWTILSVSSKGSSNGTPAPTPSPTPTPTPSPTPTSSPASSKAKTTITTTKTPAPTINPTTPPSTQDTTTTPIPTKSKPKVSYQIASVAAAAASASPSTSPEVKSSKQINFFPWVGLILILAGFTALGYIYFRQKWHNT